MKFCARKIVALIVYSRPKLFIAVYNEIQAETTYT